MTPDEENNLRGLKRNYKIQKLRGSDIEGYSVYAVENMLREAYLLGKAQKEKELNEQSKQLKNVQNS